MDISDFRPISLVSSAYKIISKVLTARLKKVLSLLIDDHQMAFLNNRQTLDNALIANEIIFDRVAQKKPGIAIKLDMEKAFDRCNWDFLLNALRKFNFHSKFVNWIEYCIKSSQLSILVNGKATLFFHPKHGLRQGDPLSPYFSIIII